MSRLTTVLLLTLLTSLSLPATPKDRQQCEQQVYAAPDARLRPHIIGRVPESRERVVGFEVIHGRPLVALPRQLIGLTDKGTSELEIPESVKGLSVDQESRVSLQTTMGFQTLGDPGLEPDETLTSAVHGRLFGSGSPVLVEARASQDVV